MQGQQGLIEHQNGLRIVAVEVLTSRVPPVLQEAERDGTGAKPEDVGRLEPSLL